MERDIKRLKELVAEFERVVQSSQPYAYEASLNTLSMIESEARILRLQVVAQRKYKS